MPGIGGLEFDASDVAAAAVPFALPMTRTFRGVQVREGMLIQGPSGWGEFAPFDDYDDLMASRWLASALEAAFGTWPTPGRTTIAVNAIIPAVDATEAAVLVRDAVLNHGCTTVKVKVGGSLAEDEARVASVRQALDIALGHGRGLIRLDANGAWELDAARVALAQLAQYRLEYVEQPCAEAEDLQALRSSCQIPIAIDEAIRRAPDLAMLRRQAAGLSRIADVAILKPTPMGGVAAALAVAEVLPIPIVVSGALESSVGLAVPAMLAGILDLDVACGLGTGSLLAADLVADPVLPVGGRIMVARRDPDLDALLDARGRMSEARARWWRQRLVRAFQAGRAPGGIRAHP